MEEEHMSFDPVKLSQTLGYMLRHKPEEFELTLDEQGWVRLDNLLIALQRHDALWSQLTIDDIKHLIKNQTKRRYEIDYGYIRAIYGHSTSDKIVHVPSEPPALLYHGTTPNALPHILKDGLKSMLRQYVHLSPKLDVATIVAKRYCEKPIILKVASKQAFEDGYEFYFANDKVWLSNDLPIKYISLA